MFSTTKNIFMSSDAVKRVTMNVSTTSFVFLSMKEHAWVSWYRFFTRKFSVSGLCHELQTKASRATRCSRPIKYLELCFIKYNLNWYCIMWKVIECEYERRWEKNVVAYFKALFLLCPGQTEQSIRPSDNRDKTITKYLRNTSLENYGTPTSVIFSGTVGGTTPHVYANVSSSNVGYSDSVFVVSFSLSEGTPRIMSKQTTTVLFQKLIYWSLMTIFTSRSIL
jgi:hypothetical protein